PKRLEVEEAEEEAQARHEPFRNLFEGQVEPVVFSGGSSDKSVLTEYEDYIARCIYERYVRAPLSIEPIWVL
ncbi:hypothetical protein A2U01_0090684, partial [Trifolium medium]|nr:hypothetical protein [Trifolium medium]